MEHFRENYPTNVELRCNDARELSGLSNKNSAKDLLVGVETLKIALLLLFSNLI